MNRSTESHRVRRRSGGPAWKFGRVGGSRRAARRRALTMLDVLFLLGVASTLLSAAGLCFQLSHRLYLNTIDHHLRISQWHAALGQLREDAHRATGLLPAADASEILLQHSEVTIRYTLVNGLLERSQEDEDGVLRREQWPLDPQMQWSWESHPEESLVQLRGHSPLDGRSLEIAAVLTRIALAEEEEP